MSRSGHLVSVLAVALVGCSDRTVVDAVEAKAQKRVHVEPVPDVADPYARPPGAATSVVVAMNHATPPPDGKQPGSGNPTAPPEATRTSLGYQIQFVSGSPVPTPAVHKGRLIVSGGFNSREVFAYDAKTGSSLWGSALSDDGPSNAACEGEICVFNTESCTTFAVNAKTGKTLWAWWLGDPETSAPTVANGLAFASFPSYQAAAIHSDYGDWDDPWGDPPAAKANQPAAAATPIATHALAAFDLKTGKPVWRRWLDGDVMSAPVAVDGFLYVTTFGGSVIKLDQKTGEIMYAVAMRATSAPVIVRDATRESLFVTVRAEERPSETKEALVRADAGATRRTFRANAKIAPYLDSKVQRDTQMAKTAQVDDSENGFATVPSTAGAQGAGAIVGVESVSTMQRFQGSRPLVVGKLVVSTMGNEVVAVDAETGEAKWRHALTGDTSAGGHLGTAPLLAGKEIVVATLGGDVIRLDSENGTLIKQYKTGAPLRTQPAVSDGWIYAGSEDGRLIAIDTGDRALTGWPTWGGDSGRSAVRL